MYVLLEVPYDTACPSSSYVVFNSLPFSQLGYTAGVCVMKLQTVTGITFLVTWCKTVARRSGGCWEPTEVDLSQTSIQPLTQRRDINNEHMCILRTCILCDTCLDGEWKSTGEVVSLLQRVRFIQSQRNPRLCAGLSTVDDVYSLDISAFCWLGDVTIATLQSWLATSWIRGLMAEKHTHFVMNAWT